ncbi:MAG: RNA pseudouridine synthase [Calditerrivibrio sp.]|nr:RNA pseudouridine synthase [Calditerrivibrio sp.]
MRLSDFLSKKYNISKRLSKKYIRKGLVYSGAIKISRDIPVEEHQDFKIILENKTYHYNPMDYILYRSPEILFLYKPPFMHTERHTPEDDLCISDIVVYESYDYKLISRLDYETDGILAAVNKKIRIEQTFKRYRAWVNGYLNNEIIFDKKIDASKKRKVSILDEKGDNVLIIKPVDHIKNYTLIEVEINYAHRHQIRAATSYLGFPIVGDKLYGKAENIRLMLQCFYTQVNNYELHLDLVKPDVSITIPLQL